MFRSTAVAVVIAASLLAACGSSSSDDATTSQAAAAPAATTPAATTPPAATPTTAATTPTTPAAGTKAQVVAQCHAAFDGTIDDLKGLESVAKMGSGYTNYNARVRQVQTAFRNITFQNAPKTGNCVQLVITNAGQSLSHYINASIAWSNCTAKKSCKDSSIAPDLQKEWKTARGLLHDAEASFAKSTT